MNTFVPTHARLAIEGEWACYRRPEFTADFVSYDAIPPLHARRLLERCIDDADTWAIRQIDVVAPISWAWLEVDTPGGRRRALALRKPHYVMHLERRANLSATAGATLAVNPAIHLGLPACGASATLLTERSLPAQDVTIDLGWMPVALAPQSPRATIYQRLRLVRGTLTLADQDESMRAR